MIIFEDPLIICHIAIYTRGKAWFNLYKISKHVRNILLIDMKRKNNIKKFLEQKSVEVFNENKFGYPYATYYEIMDKVFQNIIKTKIYDNNSPAFPITHAPYSFSENKHGLFNTQKYEHRIKNTIYVICPFCFTTINNNNVDCHIFKKCKRNYRYNICSRCHTYHLNRSSCPLYDVNKVEFNPIK